MSHVDATIRPADLLALLADPALRLVDARPLAAYNGWRLGSRF